MIFNISPSQPTKLFDVLRDQPLIAICDTDQTTRTLVGNILHENGYATLNCDISSTSATVIQYYQPDLILLDISPTRLASALQLLHLLHTDPATTGIPVVLTSVDSELLHQHWWRPYEQEYQVIPKPFDHTALLSLLAQHLEDLSLCGLKHEKQAPLSCMPTLK